MSTYDNTITDAPVAADSVPTGIVAGNLLADAPVTADAGTTQLVAGDTINEDTLISGVSYAQVIALDTPVAYWPLDETSGTVAYDKSGNGYNGTYEGTYTLNSSPLTSGTPSVLMAGGSASAVFVGDVAPLVSISTAWTLECWFKAVAVSGDQGLFAGGSGGIAIRLNGSGLDILQDQDSLLTTVATGFVAGTVYCLQVSYDGATFRIYINGSLFSTYTATATFSGSYQSLGADPNNPVTTPAYSFGGDIGQMAIYNSALSATRILAHYNAGVADTLYGIGLNDLAKAQLDAQDANLEAISLADSIYQYLLYIGIVEDKATMADVAAALATWIIAETLKAQDVFTTFLSAFQPLSESVKAVDALWIAVFITINDSPQFSDAALGAAVYLLAEQIKMQTSATSSLAGTNQVADALTLHDKLWITLALAIQEAIVAADTTQVFVKMLRVIADAVRLHDPTLTSEQANATVVEALAFLSENWTGANLGITETILMGTVLSAMRNTSASLADIAAVLDTPAHTITIALLVQDNVDFPDPPTGQVFNPSQMLNAVIDDAVQILIGWNASDGVYTGFTLNTTNQAVSQYQGWDFNSFASFRGQSIGASATQGICTLGGLADGTAAITATLQSAVTDFGNSFLKRVKMAYIGVNSNGMMYFQTVTDDNVGRTYAMVPDAPGLHTERVQLARGVMSRYWSFQLQSTGVDFRLDAVSLLPVTLERRI